MSIKDNWLTSKRKKISKQLFFPFVGAVSKLLTEIKP